MVAFMQVEGLRSLLYYRNFGLGLGEMVQIGCRFSKGPCYEVHDNLLSVFLMIIIIIAIIF